MECQCLSYEKECVQCVDKFNFIMKINMLKKIPQSH